MKRSVSILALAALLMSGLSLATNDKAEAAKWELRPCQEEHFWFYYLGKDWDAQAAHDKAKTINCKDKEAKKSNNAMVLGANTKQRGFRAKKNKADSAMVLRANAKKRRRALR